MASHGSMMKTPPQLVEADYERWKKDIEIWRKLTDLPASKQALAIHLSLTGRAREVSSELEVAELTADIGVDTLIKKLDNVFLLDKERRAFMAYQDFERFKRTKEMPIPEYMSEFDRRYYKFTKHGMSLPDTVLAFRLLESCNLDEIHFQLAMSTTISITFENMRATLKRMFGGGFKGETSHNSGEVLPSTVKVEPVLQVVGNQGYNRNRRGFRRGSVNRGCHYSKGRQDSQRRYNLPGPDGEPSKCSVCGSVFHWAKNCPDGREARNVNRDPTYLTNETATDNNVEEINLTLMAESSTYTECSQEDKLKRFLGESIGCAVLDSGCNRSVCGKNWMESYLDTLSENEKKEVVQEVTDGQFRFGDGKTVKSLKCFVVPCWMAGKKLKIRTDVVDCDIPLLLSRKAMKTARMSIDFIGDNVHLFGKTLKLNITSSGHYCLPINKNKTEVEVNEVLYSCGERNVHNMALKLHKQFAHPSAEKLIKLAKTAGHTDGDLFEEISAVTKNCDKSSIQETTSSSSCWVADCQNI